MLCLSAGPVLGLVACEEPTVPMPAPSPGTCPAADLQGLIGRDRSTLAAVGHEPVRVAGPGEAVTMDYNAERLDIRIDGDGRIVTIVCG